MAATFLTPASHVIGYAKSIKTSAGVDVDVEASKFGSLASSFLPILPCTFNFRCGNSVGLKGGSRALCVRAETRNRGMTREDGGQWLSSTTRHVRIYAAYIDPDTGAFDQTQTDKLTLILDPGNEFIWPDDKCQKVYGYFSELIDAYEGAPLTEYTLRLIGSDIEHFIRKLLFAGEIQYNLNCQVLNFSMGKPRLNIEEMEEAAIDNVK